MKNLIMTLLITCALGYCQAAGVLINGNQILPSSQITISSVTATGNGFKGNGSALTSLTPGNVSAGQLPATVYISSINTGSYQNVKVGSATVSNYTTGNAATVTNGMYSNAGPYEAVRVGTATVATYTTGNAATVTNGVYLNANGQNITGNGFYFTGGNVGIGTTSPASTVTVQGTIGIYQAGTGGLGNIHNMNLSLYGAGGTGNLEQIGFGYDTTLNYHPVVIGERVVAQSGQTDGAFFVATRNGTSDSAPSEVFTILPSGNVGIGTTNPGTSLDVAGTIRQSTVKSCTLGLTTDSNGGITGCVASDIGLKDSIQNIPYDSSLIDNLNPVFYVWKDTETRDSQQHAGFIAQDVNSIFPQAVVDAGTGIKGIDSNALIAVLVKEIQSMKNRIYNLENK